MGPYAYLALIGLGQAIALGIVTLRRGWPLNPFGDLRVLLFAGSLLAVLAAYYQALRWGPVGPVAAIHLSTPVLLVAWEAMQRRRVIDKQSTIAVVLLIGGAATAGLGKTNGSGPHPELALLLALLSAVLMAVHTWQLANWGPTVNIRAAVVPKALLQTVVFAPLAIAAPPPDIGYALLVIAGLGVLVTAPATLMQWSALAALPATIGASVTLTEALFAAAWATIAFGRSTTGLEAAATVLVVLGVTVEMRHPTHRVRSFPRSSAPAQSG
jgi:drug/metabolite transporter (DMT)-like permease